MKLLIFVVVLAAALGFFARTLYAMVRAVRRGNDDQRPRFDQIPSRIGSVILYFFLQKRVAEEGPDHMTSKHHLLIFWGFLLITVASAEVLIAGVWHGFSLNMVMPDVAYEALRFAIDLVTLVVLIVIGWAFFRRIVIKPHLIPMNLDAALILGAIASLMITHFLFHGLHIAAGAGTDSAAPVSSIVAGWVRPITPSAAALGSDVAYWLHVVILLTFLNYLPYSKHIHLLGAMPNIFLRNLSDRRLDLPKLDLEDENQWGVGRFEQFSWKSLVDTYACTECARCTNYCPAYATNKNLSPMQLVHDIRYEMLDRDSIYADIEALKTQRDGFPVADDCDDDHKPADLVQIEADLAALETKLEDMPPMVSGRIAEDTLWACTTCGACQEVCPVFIEHPLKIIQMRQNLVLEQEKVPADLARTFRNIERQSNPWGISNEKRMEWAAGLDVPTIEENENPEYLLWVGCAGAFDNRIQKQTRAMIKILRAAKVDFAVLGKQEGCTGDPARRSGNEFLFEMQAEANIEVLNGSGIVKVVTSCPHCLHTLRNDYPQYGGNFEVVHHTQLIADLLQTGALKPENTGTDKITYHDSCYLGRWNGEFDAPRDVLAAVNKEAGIVELKRNRRHGFCCGAGGGRMFVEEEAPRVNTNRSDEVIEAEVDAVAVACPFCNIMLTDGMKERDKEDDIKVLDLAELVADSIPDVAVDSLVRHRDS